MDQSDPKGAFGDTLARYYHQSESTTAVTSWPEQSTFAITRLHSEVGLPDVSQPIPEEAAIHVSIAIKPVPLRSYELYIDDRRIEVPFIPAYRTSIIDLESHPICTVDCGFDYVHYHAPREGLDEIARDHKIKPVGIYKFGICEDDLVIAQLTKNIMTHVGPAEWTQPACAGPVQPGVWRAPAPDLWRLGSPAGSHHARPRTLAATPGDRASVRTPRWRYSSVPGRTGMRHVRQPFRAIIQGELRRLRSSLARPAADRASEGAHADDAIPPRRYRAGSGFFGSGVIQPQLPPIRWDQPGTLAPGTGRTVSRPLALRSSAFRLAMSL
jgi:hypothetical protein